MGTHQLGNWLTNLKIQLRDKNLLQTTLAPPAKGQGETYVVRMLSCNWSTTLQEA